MDANKLPAERMLRMKRCRFPCPESEQGLGNEGLGILQINVVEQVQ